MEELGIGRPSTYASILSALQDRNYVRLEGKRLIPEDRGRLVTAFLSSFFERYVDTTSPPTWKPARRGDRRREDWKVLRAGSGRISPGDRRHQGSPDHRCARHAR